MIWLRIGAVESCFECGSEVLDSTKCGVFFLLAENLLAFQEGLFSMDLVS